MPHFLTTGNPRAKLELVTKIMSFFLVEIMLPVLIPKREDPLQRQRHPLHILVDVIRHIGS